MCVCVCVCVFVSVFLNTDCVHVCVCVTENPGADDVRHVRRLQVRAVRGVSRQQEIRAQEQLHGGVLRPSLHALQ